MLVCCYRADTKRSVAVLECPMNGGVDLQLLCSD